MESITSAVASSTASAIVTPTATPDLGAPQSQARAWFEPVLVLGIMLGSLIINRRRSQLNFWRTRDLHDSTRTLLHRSESDSDDDDSLLDGVSEKPVLVRSRPSFDTARYAGYLHNRLIQKFPFLVEMFYWVLNYLTYLMTKEIAFWLYSDSAHQVAALAQRHGIDIMNFEHHSIFRFFFISEVAVQTFVLQHKWLISAFNQIYSLVHIPGTVSFLSWYYWAAPNFETFALARRTMTLGNFAAFFVFSLYPCMPPRLLPESYGFKDTVRQEHAESVWAKGSNVNELAAMPSLHFTYAFIVGITFLHHSGLPQAMRGRKSSEPRRSWAHTLFFVSAAISYPVLVLAVIVATANHYWLDAVVATGVVLISYQINRIWFVLLPLENLFCWIFKIHKPIPTTGQHSIAAEETLIWRKERQSLEISPERRPIPV